jgi:hypothetical protein
VTLSVEWLPEAEEALLGLPSLREIERVSKAVYRFAEAGEGVVLVGEHHGDLRLVVGRFIVSFRIEEAATLIVRRVSVRP